MLGTAHSECDNDALSSRNSIGGRSVSQKLLLSSLIVLTIHAAGLDVPAWSRSSELEGVPSNDSPALRDNETDRSIEEALRWLAVQQKDVDGWNLDRREVKWESFGTSVSAISLHIFNSYRSVFYALRTLKPPTDDEELHGWDLE